MRERWSVRSRAAWVLLLSGCAAGTGQSAPADVEAEARRFVDAYLAEIQAGDFDAAIARYHPEGAWRVGNGEVEFLPLDSIAHGYAQAVAPSSFEWEDVSFEVLSTDAVVFVGTFRAQFLADAPTITSITGLLIRQDGEFRIRLEDESSRSPRSFSCDTEDELCEHPLEPMGASRFIGEYESGSGRIRVFERDGQLMVEPPLLPAMRMLYDGNDEFRLPRAPSYIIRFAGDGPKATSLAVFRGASVTAGQRVR